MSPKDKPLVWMHGEVKSPPFSALARIEAGYLLRLLQRGNSLSLPHSRPMPSIGRRYHELRINGQRPLHNYYTCQSIVKKRLKMLIYTSKLRFCAFFCLDLASLATLCRGLGQSKTWRIVYRIDDDAILVLEVFEKKTQKTPKARVDVCKQRMKVYDDESQ